MDVLRILAILLGAAVLYGIATTYQEYILEKFGKNIFSGGVIASLALVEFLFWYAIGFRKLSWDNEVVLILLGTLYPSKKSILEQHAPTEFCGGGFLSLAIELGWKCPANRFQFLSCAHVTL